MERNEANVSQLDQYLLELRDIYEGYYTPFGQLFLSGKQFDPVLFENFINEVVCLSVPNSADESTMTLYRIFLRTTISFLLVSCNPSDWYLKSIVKITKLLSDETKKAGWETIKYRETVYSYLCEADESEAGTEVYNIFMEIQPIFENLFNKNVIKCCVNMPADILNGIRIYIDKHIPNIFSSEEVLNKAADTLKTASYYAKKDMGLISSPRRSKV